jgi:hypothetical protein
MATLISVYNSSGCVGRCDAHCYNANHGTKCECICGGANHAAGEQRAVDNVRNYTQKKLDEIQAKGGWVPDEFKQKKLL